MEVVWRATRSAGRSLLAVQKRSLYSELDKYKHMDKNSAAPSEITEPGIIKSGKSVQFTKSVLKQHGELPFGEIPEPLKYTRPFQMTTLSNGVRVCTEYWPAKVASVGVVIGAGSRHETLDTSGTAHFMEHLHFKV